MQAKGYINYNYTPYKNVGIFSFAGELVSDHADELKLLLMQAIYRNEHAVLNFRDITFIDSYCLRLLREAYCTSIRLKNPIILTEFPQIYVSELFECDEIKMNLITNLDENKKRVEI